MSGFNMPPGVSTRDIPGQDDDGLTQASAALTLRDYFAAKAMAGMLANPAIEPMYAELRARGAYAIADAMLEARNA